ncbi:ABC transporter permease [Ktedonosporobacter rubrisoli]|uniref:ABC transporter permease n=1 Tax=Ktedonosporobacter rubrisoli TaxID=2509675 RepID=A0A4P6JV25_KTERU|nr:ABC transporter permease [Ktedonosporobacter rubrisoli]QBD78796.1 ABC transporter permease [Ktedonosporobacter rubrisoli]
MNRSPALTTTLPGEKSVPARILDILHAVWRQLTINKKVATGSVIVAIFVIVAIIGPFFVSQTPNAISHVANAKPSAEHLLGTTDLGQDIFSQLVAGTRNSIFWGFVTGLAVTIISMVVGLVAGYFGGIVDDILSLLTNVFLVLPGLPLAIVFASYFPHGEVTVALAVILTNWAWGARMLRAQTLSVRSREFVTAARSCGESAWRIIFFEILPNEISIIAANFVSTTIFVILAIASLEYLGLGDFNTVSWGMLLYEAQVGQALFANALWWFVPPGLCIALLGAGLALINFGIDEIADPRLRTEPTLKRIKKKLIHQS